jgi:hypothetical protein
VQLLLPSQELSSPQAAGGLQLGLAAAGNGWQKVSGAFQAGATSDGARLAISFVGPGTILVDMVSLFPAGAAPVCCGALLRSPGPAAASWRANLAAPRPGDGPPGGAALRYQGHHGPQH